MPRGYVYEVVRVRLRELLLFTVHDIKYLLSCADYGECLVFLNSKGWGGGRRYNDYELILDEELRKSWDFILELSKSKEPFAVFLCQNDYENLKICIKSIVTNSKEEFVCSPEGLLLPGEIYEIIENNEIEKLPSYMQSATKEAIKTLLQTEDGQLCDIILDKDMLTTMDFFAKQSDCDLVKYYSSTFIACANIKTVVRGMRAGNDAEFFKKACAKCDGMDVDRLIQAGLASTSELFKYLASTSYSDCIKALEKSPSELEKWRDDRITERAQREKVDPFSIGPLVAYMLAKMNEVRLVRMIIMGKINGVPKEVLRERLRRIYA
ncbi:MAG: V-type ATPase subunit [Oscillospiraceae bacterium]|jgi:V/A-type H+-transporting ATPase subunit C|nr:V-type ATPase subunit [Oscillospiraceae bacterium]